MSRIGEFLTPSSPSSSSDSSVVTIVDTPPIALSTARSNFNDLHTAIHHQTENPHLNQYLIPHRPYFDPFIASTRSRRLPHHEQTTLDHDIQRTIEAIEYYNAEEDADELIQQYIEVQDDLDRMGVPRQPITQTPPRYTPIPPSFPPPNQ